MTCRSAALSVIALLSLPLLGTWQEPRFSVKLSNECHCQGGSQDWSHARLLCRDCTEQLSRARWLLKDGPLRG
ncbi:hypothetical protein LZ32DRAFT_602470 [Colletotrichum eremochloae]|nr:hypothetical protein LZ32DRAFT_602470 [Colletotrichum eremochloae]